MENATNKYAMVNAIRKRRNVFVAKDGYVIVDGKDYNLETGAFDKRDYDSQEVICFTCSAKGRFVDLTWRYIDPNLSVEYPECETCYYRKVDLCRECCMPKRMCTKAKVTTILILKKHLHRDTLNIILKKIHN